MACRFWSAPAIIWTARRVRRSGQGAFLALPLDGVRGLRKVIL